MTFEDKMQAALQEYEQKVEAHIKAEHARLVELGNSEEDASALLMLKIRKLGEPS
jgi:hypothetical protein